MTRLRPSFPCHLLSRRAIDPLRVWLPALALLGLCGAFAPPAGATSTGSLAAVTDATTGLRDASSVVPLDACGSATAVRAACLAEVLGVRGNRTTTVTLNLRSGSRRVTLSVLSSWNGYSATVTATA